ncbi:MAG TPA: hypothetical protein VHG28_09815 [Longimicrobiaceae bacterium]|nr:hypothetical protein [Longimicrobiaceae bacterium]
MKKLVALAAVLLVLAFLNPSEAEHRARFAETFRADHPVLSLFGADRLAPVLLTYRSYGIASVGWVGDEVVTVGVLGRVRVREVDMEKLAREAAEKGERTADEISRGLSEGAGEPEDAGSRT